MLFLETANASCITASTKKRKKKKREPNSISQGSVPPAPTLGARQGLPCRLCSAVSGAEG